MSSTCSNLYTDPPNIDGISPSFTLAKGRYNSTEPPSTNDTRGTLISSIPGSLRVSTGPGVYTTSGLLLNSAGTRNPTNASDEKSNSSSVAPITSARALDVSSQIRNEGSSEDSALSRPLNSTSLGFGDNSTSTKVRYNQLSSLISNSSNEPSYISANTNSTRTYLSKTSLSRNGTITDGSEHGNDTESSCWGQWESYWSGPLTTQITSTYSTGTYFTVFTATLPGLLVFHTPSISTWTYVVTQDGFTLSTVTTTITPPPETPDPTSAPSVTITETESYLYVLITVLNVTVSATPNCSLPSIVPQCQSAWNTFASDRILPAPNVSLSSCDVGSPCESNYASKDATYSSYISKHLTAPPQCSQASLASPLCSALRSSYEAAGFDNWNEPVTSGTFDWLAYTGTAWLNIGGFSAEIFWSDRDASESTITSYWPSTSRLAPGCSLGCGSCAITGGTIGLIHWPVTSNGTDYLNSNGQEVVTALGTEFTSPTVYVSFASLYAGNSLQQDRLELLEHHRCYHRLE